VRPQEAANPRFKSYIPHFYVNAAMALIARGVGSLGSTGASSFFVLVPADERPASTELLRVLWMDRAASGMLRTPRTCDSSRLQREHSRVGF
jgi:hypothetical protein